MKFSSINVAEAQKIPETLSLEAVVEVPAFPGATITFKGFLPGFDPENMALNANADAGDLLINLEIAGESTIYILDENGVWTEDK